MIFCEITRFKTGTLLPIGYPQQSDITFVGVAQRSACSFLRLITPFPRCFPLAAVNAVANFLHASSYLFSSMMGSKNFCRHLYESPVLYEKSTRDAIWLLFRPETFGRRWTCFMKAGRSAASFLAEILVRGCLTLEQS